MKRFLLVLFVLFSLPVYAQNTNQAQLRLVIVDETGAGIPNATIIITPAAGVAVTFSTDERGMATSPSMLTGNVTLHVEFEGFQPYEGQLTLRRGAMNQTVTLKIAGVQEEVVVSDTTATDDRRGNSFSTTLEESEIEELPEDPDELADVLTAMAGGSGAIFQVNGFRGGRLPSRDEIRQIRFRTNSFSADNHDAGRTQIEIITRPNVQRWNGNGSFNYRSDSMNARNAFSRAKTPEQNRNFNLGARGPIVKGKTSIRLGLDGRRDYQADTIVAIDEFGNRLGDYVRRPSDSTNATVGLEHALTNNQTLRLEYRRGQTSTENSGVGGFNLPERAYSSSGSNNQVRAQAQGIVGKNMLHEVRLQVYSQESSAVSVSAAPAIIVLDAFSKGGAGVSREGSSRVFEFAENLDFNVGRKQQMRVGFLLDGGRYQNFDAQNVAGTYTYATIQDYKDEKPLTFTRREGLVNTSFNQYTLGFYWSDDIRLNNKFSFGVGVRNEMQSHINDHLNLMPRLGFTWTPWGNRTAIRGGYGLFHDWYESNLYDQTLRVNGIAQRDLVIRYDEEGGEESDPPARIQGSPDLKMPKVHQASIGIERQVTQNLTVQATYQMLRGRNQMRSININAPDEFGVRHYDPLVGNVTEFNSTGKSLSDRLELRGVYRIPSRGIFMNLNYTLGQVKNHADSATLLPANNLDPDAEWGPSRQDVRHRLQGQVNVPIFYGIRTSINVQAQSATPYTITTGIDNNRDGVVNDRPVGIGRNTERGASTWVMNLNLTKQIALGPRTGQGGDGGGPGGGGFPGGGGRPGGFPSGAGGGNPGPGAGTGGAGGGGNQQIQFAQGPGGRGGQGGGGRGNRGGGGGDAQFNARYSMEFFIRADNVLNHVNYGSFSGNQLSPFFGQPTNAQQPRRLTVGSSFRF
jgi:Carboxypeptidase regulatory-like domain